MMEKPVCYLGDGVYAEYLGYDVRVWTDRQDGTHEVYLEPYMVAGLLEFIKREQESK